MEKKGGKERRDRGRRFLADVRFHNGLRSEIILAHSSSLAQVYSLLRLWQSGHHAGNSHH
jgi:hypothetical protein